MKKVLPFLTGPGQTAHVNGRFLGESGRLIADVIDTCDLEQLEGYLAAIDFEKAFDSLSHNFLITALEHCGLLKLVSAIFIMFLFIHQMTALPKL